MILRNSFISRILPAMAGAVLLLAGCSSSPEVTLKEDAETYTLDNGIICARVSKVTGDLVSLRYNGTEMLATTLQPDFIPEPQTMPTV